MPSVGEDPDLERISDGRERQMIWVISASYDGDYRIALEFNDGMRGMVDLRAQQANLCCLARQGALS